MKGLATLSAAAAIMLGGAIPAGANAAAGQPGCEQLGNVTLALRGFDAGVQTVDRDGDAAQFLRVPRNNMFRCMFVDFNAGVAYTRGVRGLPLSASWALKPYIDQAYLAGRAQRDDR